MEKTLIISTSYSDVDSEIKQIAMILKTVGFEVDIAKNIPSESLSDDSFIQQYKYYFCLITNNWEQEISQEVFLKAIELINDSGNQYWTVCDQRTIYARTILKDLEDISDLPSKFKKHYIYILIHIYHVFTKEHITDPDSRSGNWVHPYRVLKEINKYFSVQIEYALDE